MLKYEDFQKLDLSDLLLNIWSYAIDKKKQSNYFKIFRLEHKNCKKKKHKDFYDFHYVINKRIYNNHKQFDLGKNPSSKKHVIYLLYKD